MAMGRRKGEKQIDRVFLSRGGGLAAGRAPIDDSSRSERASRELVLTKERVIGARRPPRLGCWV